MKRLIVLSLLAMIVASSSGCCLFDRLFGCQRGYPIAPRGRLGRCGAMGCNVGSCDSCGGAGCDSCDAGVPAGMMPDEAAVQPFEPGAIGPTTPDVSANNPDGTPGYGYAPAQPMGGMPMGAGYGGMPAGYGGPVGQTVWPYYTTRGPRDFLDKNPRSIGPY